MSVDQPREDDPVGVDDSRPRSAAVPGARRRNARDGVAHDEHFPRERAVRGEDHPAKQERVARPCGEHLRTTGQDASCVRGSIASFERSIRGRINDGGVRCGIDDAGVPCGIDDAGVRGRVDDEAGVRGRIDRCAHIGGAI